jgi:myo-inositol-1(or 4)-monophosphatase
VAVNLARRTGELLRRGQSHRHRIQYKGAINLVTEMDLKAEKLITAGLKEAFPKHDLLAEEDKRSQSAGAVSRWIVDPLDGTTNYAHGLPIYAVSIALEQRGEIVVGVVYQPVLDELFVAVKGGGATLNGKRITVSRAQRLDRSLLVTGFPYDLHDTEQDNLDHFHAFMKSARAVRRLGSAALDLCYVACGRFDGFWEIKLSPWDLAAGALICREAGARVTGIDGRAFSIYDGHVIASNSRIHAQMVRVLARDRK